MVATTHKIIYNICMPDIRTSGWDKSLKEVAHHEKTYALYCKSMLWHRKNQG